MSIVPPPGPKVLGVPEDYRLLKLSKRNKQKALAKAQLESKANKRARLDDP